MSQNRDLLWRAFIQVNTPKFAHRPSAVERIQQVNDTNTSFETYAMDPNNVPYGRVANIESGSLMIDAVNQRWTCALLSNAEVTNFTRPETFANLNALIDYNKKGIFKYTDMSDTKIGQIVVTEATDPALILGEVVKQLNQFTNYKIYTDDCTLNALSTNVWELSVAGEVIAGEITVIRYDSTKIVKGNYLLGYMGEVSSDEFISGTLLGMLVGLEDRIINPEPIWLKFSFWGRIIYIPKNPLINNIAPDLLIEKHLIRDNIIVDLNSAQYFVRCIKGTGNDEVNEWNELIYRVSKDDPTHTFWEEFTNEQLTVGRNAQGGLQYGNGTIAYDRNSNGAYVYRGFDSLTDSKEVMNTSAVNPYFGWRPAVIFDGVKAVTVSHYSMDPDPLVLMTEPEYVNVGALRVNNVRYSIPDAKDVQIVSSEIGGLIEGIALDNYFVVNERDIVLTESVDAVSLTLTGTEMLNARNIDLTITVGEHVEPVQVTSANLFPAPLYLI